MFYLTFALWPDLFTYTFFVPTLLRLFLGISLLRFGLMKLIDRAGEAEVFRVSGFKNAPAWVWLIGICETIVGTLLIIGLFTQLAALLAVLIMLGAILSKKRAPEHAGIAERYYGALLVIGLSLVFLGAGAFAFDYPF